MTPLNLPELPGRKLVRLPVLWLVWAAVALIIATQTHIYDSVLRQTFPDINVSWKESFRFPLVECLFWALLTPAIFWLSERFPVVSRQWQTNIGSLVVANTAVVFLHAVYRTPLTFLVYPRMPAMPFFRLFQIYLLGNGLTDAWVFWTIVAIVQVVSSYTRSLDRERELARAQLQALTAQLQPHFLFNVLNSVSSLMREDVDSADEMIERLSHLIRTTLKNSSPQEVSLREELQVVNQYVEIEHMRFLERLRYAVRANDETLKAAVPRLLLLPVVENAVRYAITPRTLGGSIDIEARREQNTLAVRVTDDGPGIPEGLELREGIGLSNTRTRLHKHYAGSASFTYRNLQPTGFTVEFRLPFRLAAEEVYDDTCADRG